MATSPYIYLNAPLNYNESPSDVDIYTSYTDSLGQPSRALWWLNQVGSNTWQGTIDSGNRVDSSDVIPIYVPVGYAITGYSLTISNVGINQSANFDFGASDGRPYDDYRPLATLTSPNGTVLGAGSYNVTIGGGVNVLSYSFQLNIVKVNEAPTVMEDYNDPTFNIGGAAVNVFSNTAVSTVESGQLITKFSLSVDGVVDTASEFLTLGGTDIHLAAGGSGTLSNGIAYTTTGSGTSVAINLSMPSGITSGAMATLLDNMTYKNTSADATQGDRQVNLLSISDNGGTANGGIDTADLYDYSIVTVAPAPNASPVVVVSGGSTAFIESAGPVSSSVVIDNTLTVTDTDDTTLASAKVTITGNLKNAEDVLGLTLNGATGDISATYTASTGELVLTSASGTASLAQWQAALQSVSYTNTSNNPDTSPRTISIVVNDGHSDSTVVTKTVTVAATNDVPVVTTSGGSTDFVEGDNVVSTPVVVDSGLTLSDRDNTTLASATVAITVNHQIGEDVLSFTNTNSVQYGNISAVYNAATGELQLNSVGNSATLAQWQAALNAVTYTDTAITPNTAPRTISFSVNDSHNSSLVATKTVNVAATHQTPILTVSAGVTEFHEGQNTASTPVVIDAGLTISDLDSPTLASATVSLRSATSDESLGFTNDGTNMGDITASYASGTLTLTSAQGATLAQWQLALRSVTYQNDSDNPSVGEHLISFKVNDGNSESVSSVKTVYVNSVNDSPVIHNTTGTTPFTEGNNVAATPVVINSQLTLSDPDNATLTSAKVSITDKLHVAEDILSFTNDGLTMGDIIGNYDLATGVMSMASLSGTATLAQWEAALHAVMYTNTSKSPSNETRTISFVVNDGDADSNVATQQVSVTPTDDTPIISSTAPLSVTFTEGLAPVVINPSITITDADSLTMTGAKVKIGGYQAGEDHLAFTGDNATTGNITATFNPLTGELSLISVGGTATLAQWETALSLVTYENTSDAATGTSRTITYTVSDGHSSASVNTTVDLVAINDAPVVTLSATQSVRQDTALVFSSANHNAITISDVDAGNSSMTATLVANHGVVTVSPGSGALVLIDSITGYVSVTGTLAQINAALNGLKFTPDTAYTGHASLSVLIDDQGQSAGHPDPLTDLKSIDITVSATPVTPPVTPPTNPPVTVDGVPVTTTQVTLPNGETGNSISVGLVTDSRQDSTGDANKADIDLVGSGTNAGLSAKLPVGYGLTSVGGSAKTVGDSAETLKAAIDAVTPGSDQAHQNVNGQKFLDKLADSSDLLVNTITPITATTAPTQALELDGSSGSQLTALVIDASQMNGKGSLDLNNVDFAAVIGQTTVQGNTVGQVLTGDDANQSFIVNASNSFVFAGGGNDTLQITSFAAANNTVLQGGQGNDTVQFSGDRSLYTIEQHGGFTIVSNKNDPNQQVKVVNVENLSFADGAVSIQTDTQQTTLAALYQGLLGRQADVAGFDYWTQQPMSIGGIGLSILNSTEAGAKALNGDVSHDIAALYSAFFGRTADEAGQAYWTEQVQQGHMTFVQVADSLLTSVEMGGHNKAASTWDFTVS
ncbi:DUF4214 domain-containing protein [Pseudomonas sp. NPDC090202]|uniref:DUF4214 domain-containing protein n=1 Tax=unclassified Pseudomonas TaxID=196821 RepID=UPI0037FB2A77